MAFSQDEFVEILCCMVPLWCRKGLKFQLISKDNNKFCFIQIQKVFWLPHYVKLTGIPKIKPKKFTISLNVWPTTSMRAHWTSETPGGRSSVVTYTSMKEAKHWTWSQKLWVCASLLPRASCTTFSKSRTFSKRWFFSTVKAEINRVSPTTSQVVWLQLSSKCESICKFLSCANIKCYYEINKTYLVKEKNPLLKSK